MGSWWHVEVGKLAAPVFGKKVVSDRLMLVFSDADRFLDHVKQDDRAEFEKRLADDDGFAMDDGPRSWHTRLMGYSATAGDLRSRLGLQGFSSDRVRSLSNAFFDDELTPNAEYGGTDPRDSWPEGPSRYPDGAAVTAALASRFGQASAAAPRFKLTDPEQQFLHDQWESLRESFDDPRFALSLALTNTRANTMVTLDLTDLVLGGWMAADDVPHQEARTRMAAAVAASGPVIVIAEGASDARWLRRSLEIAAPAAAHLFEFLDFSEYRAPGGTDRVVSLTKGMAAARVMNRIVAVLDNDTAGRVAAKQLADLALPARIAVANLPEIEFANHYPTLGPGSSSTSNVNGRAASIEFMFGEDILRGANGALFPVRWQSFIDSASEYQGRLQGQHKATAAQRIDQALAPDGVSPMSDQVHEGCCRLASMLLAAAEPPPHIPASEFSDLTASWRKGQST